MSNNPTHKKQWQELHALAKSIKDKRSMEFFNDDKGRFDNFSFKTDGLLFDYSKQRVTKEILETLYSLLEKSDFDKKRQAMFDGQKINHTEGRAVLHTALRRPINDSVSVDGENVIPQIHTTLDRMKDLSEKLHNGTIKGSTGEKIDTIVSIGIGGSDLGPRMIFQGLDAKYESPLSTYFVSNIDGEDINSVLNKCNSQTTLFIIISKTFTTQETLTNANTAREWVRHNLPDGSDISPHFLAVSSNINATREFGMDDENIYPMWEWVNGRFSLWSAVGLPLCLHFGFNVFRELLDGAYAADKHFYETPLDKNIPVILAMLGIWNRNFLEHSHHALLPYTEKLKYMPAFVQQLEMESNGKSVNNKSKPITDYDTCPVIFGEVGTNGQHSFYQLLHQGTDKVPCDFIGVKISDNDLDNHHILLLSHMLAQGQAMLQGRPHPDAPYRYFDGNIPSTTFLFDTLGAYHLGFLTAIYEHKTFVQGIVWNVNSFDQYGVELGKELAKKLENQDLGDADPSTKALYSVIHKR